jgi:hypothetical protein
VGVGVEVVTGGGVTIDVEVDFEVEVVVFAVVGGGVEVEEVVFLLVDVGGGVTDELVLEVVDVEVVFFVLVVLVVLPPPPSILVLLPPPPPRVGCPPPPGIVMVIRCPPPRSIIVTEEPSPLPGSTEVDLCWGRHRARGLKIAIAATKVWVFILHARNEKKRGLMQNCSTSSSIKLTSFELLGMIIRSRSSRSTSWGFKCTFPLRIIVVDINGAMQDISLQSNSAYLELHFYAPASCGKVFKVEKDFQTQRG